MENMSPPLLDGEMEPRKHLHQLIDTLPDSLLERAAQRLIALREHAPEEELSLLVADLGWTPEQAADTRSRLASFAEDWDAPGMEGYDKL